MTRRDSFNAGTRIFLLLAAMLSPGTLLAQPVVFGPISVGPPLNGTTVMDGFSAVIMRVRSNSGPILSVDFAGTHGDGQPRGFFGRFAQRWTSSLGDGVYDVPSPGFLAANNLTDSELNFDTHFLGGPGAFTVTTPLSEGNVLFPGANPIPSTPLVGYGVSPRFGTGPQGFLVGQFDLNVPNVTTFDVAYFAFGDGFTYRGRFTTTNGSFDVSGTVLGPPVPEPMSSGCAFVGLVLLQRRWSRGFRAEAAFVETRREETKCVQPVAVPCSKRSNLESSLRQVFRLASRCLWLRTSITELRA